MDFSRRRSAPDAQSTADKQRALRMMLGSHSDRSFEAKRFAALPAAVREICRSDVSMTEAALVGSVYAAVERNKGQAVSISFADLGKGLHLNQAQTLGLVDRLVSKGLLIETRKGASRLYTTKSQVAAPASNLSKVLGTKGDINISVTVAADPLPTKTVTIPVAVAAGGSNPPPAEIPMGEAIKSTRDAFGRVIAPKSTVQPVARSASVGLDPQLGQRPAARVRHRSAEPKSYTVMGGLGGAPVLRQKIASPVMSIGGIDLSTLKADETVAVINGVATVVKKDRPKA
jgi:hypothetical protein